ncbi:MAG: hypothetical protein HDS70_05815 [Bacteroidales bacterium]|nr:hypothetical protein [Bacteroidales bacterium]MBD5221869.1 hypothetical protein [Bacteroidales bacterium]
MEKQYEDLIKDDERVGMGKFLRYLLKCWWAVAACVVIFAALGYVYSKIKSEKYEVMASIIMNDTDSDGKGTLGGGLGSLFSSFNMGGASYKLVEDEIRRIQSRGNLEEVVKMLNLNSKNWSKSGMLKPKVWYYNDAPLTVSLPAAVADTLSATTKFRIDVAEGGKEIHVKAEQPMGKTVLDQTYKAFPIQAKTPRGTFRIDKSVTYNPSEPLTFYNVTTSPKIYAESLYKDIDMASPTKKSNIIYMSIDEVRPDRGEDILNNLVAIYNLRSIETGHEEARAAIDFIDERMVELYQQLQNSEKSIETYKKANNIVDPEAEAEYIFKKKGGAETAIVEQRTKAGVSQMIIDFLRNENTRYSLIPFTSDAPEAPIQAYNELALERLRLEQNAKGNNASLKGVTAQMDAMRANLISTMERELSATRIAIGDLEKVNHESESRIGQVPSIERKLTELYRNQTIQNQIYGFMLQKREENQLKLAREIPAGRIMEKAYSSTEPKGLGGKILIILFGFLGGILGVGGLYIVYWYQNRCDRLASASLDERD